MKRFIFQFLIFLIPFLTLLAGIELYIIFNPSTFNTKASYLKRNFKSIETLVLGSSHNQNAINPQFLKSKTANLANAGQDIQMDSALFFKYVSKLPSLKLVILEMDYHSLEEKNDSTYFRLPWYKRFYCVEPYPVSLLNRISLYSSQPSFFNKLIADELNPKKIRYKVNKYGFIINDFPGVMEDLKYDTASLERTAAERLHDKHKINSPANFTFNTNKVNSIINYCISHNIKVMILSTPMYKTYIENEIPEKNMRRKRYIDSLQLLPHVSYFNYENTGLFSVHDFKNDDHLNSNGAQKFSLIVDSLTRNLKP